MSVSVVLDTSAKKELLSLNLTLGVLIIPSLLASRESVPWVTTAQEEPPLL
jgi:hypothetical protein